MEDDDDDDEEEEDPPCVCLYAEVPTLLKIFKNLCVIFLLVCLIMFVFVHACFC